MLHIFGMVNWSGLLAQQRGQRMKPIQYQYCMSITPNSATQMQYGTRPHIVHTCCDLTSGIEQESRNGLTV
jgi:hypothetical protein